MADVRKFTGFIAIDNTHHNTMKAASDHTREVKIKAALEQFKVSDSPLAERPEDNTKKTVFLSDMPTWLYENREAIKAAFAQDVVIRAPRTKKLKDQAQALKVA